MVREKVDDLALAAAQAEQELKMRVDVKQQSPEHYDNYIDPTDAVDLPPPSENSPFAFQASALRGLGVENSVGAAVLAERLPPGTPGVWSIDPDEEAWRKALLQEAVGHSLNNTPDHSFRTPSHTTTPSSGSMGPSFAQSSPSPGPRTSSTPSTKRNLGQRIVDILEEQHEAIILQTPTHSPEESACQLQARERTVSTASHIISQLPSRAETPAEPQTALPLPPRAPAKLPRASMSTESPGDSLRISQYSTTGSVLRKTSSSPMLHFWHDGAARRSRAVVSMTPPLVPRGRASSVITSPGFMTRDSMTSGSHYSMQEDPESIEHLGEPESANSRPSFSSLPSRPSVSEYSQVSPTVSAFNDGHFNTAPSIRESMSRDDYSDAGDLEVSHDDEDPTRTRYLSPPPRTSSSLAIHSLHPPPRFPASREPSPTLVAHHPLLKPRPSASSSDPGDSSEMPSAYSTAVELPDTIDVQSELPPFPLGQHHTVISSLSIPSTMHSAPPPASPEFFDQIQAGHNDMDDWESSDESDGDEDDSAYVEPAGHSTPHESSQGHSSASLSLRMASAPVSPAASRDDLSAHTANSDPQERLPVVNVPRPPAYFKNTRGDQPLTSYDLYRLSRLAAASSSSQVSSETQARPGTSEDRSQTRREGRTPSMQRLDGLVLQHMEAERGTLSRIARTVKDAQS